MSVKYLVKIYLVSVSYRDHYKAGQLGPYKAGQVGPYKATHPLIWGARVTPIRPLLSICDKIVNLWEKKKTFFFRKNLEFQKP